MSAVERRITTQSTIRKTATTFSTELDEAGKRHADKKNPFFSSAVPQILA